MNQPASPNPDTRRGRDNAAAADPSAIMRIRNLELRARLVVEGFMSGLHRSPYHGFSVEFTDYRQYSPGDDLRYLDWKLLARADRSYIKRFEDETNLRCYLLVDFSHSMEFPQGPASKRIYAQTVAATLAQFLAMQHDAVGALTFADHLLDVVPPRYRRGHLRRIMSVLDQATVGAGTDVGLPLSELASSFTRRGMVILISDLLTPIEDFERNLRYLRSRGHDILVLRVLAPEEIEFDFSAATLFHDLESNREIFVDPATAASDYRERFAAHEFALRNACESMGIGFHQMLTTEPFGDALFQLIQRRQRMGQQVRRSGALPVVAGGEQ